MRASRTRLAGFFLVLCAPSLANAAVDATLSASTVALAALSVGEFAEPTTALPDLIVENAFEVVPTPTGFSLSEAASEAASASAAAQATPARRPIAFEYSDAYNLRRKIHNYASWATLPLFGVEYLLGNKLWDDPVNSSVRDAHGAVATAIAGLFGVNTVTGVWNLWEGRKDPNGRKKRLWHSFLMLGSDAGFLATGALAPSLVNGGGNRDLHRAVAISSVAVASTSYLIMLLSR